MIAAEENKSEVVQYLLEKGADTDIQDTNGHTLLWYCRKYGHGEGFEKIINLLEKESGESNQSVQIVKDDTLAEIIGLLDKGSPKPNESGRMKEDASNQCQRDKQIDFERHQNEDY